MSLRCERAAALVTLLALCACGAERPAPRSRVAALGAPQGVAVWNPFAENSLARDHAAMAYDSVRGRTVVFGGHSGAQQPLPQTWEWDGTSWFLAAATGPPSGDDWGLAFDSKRARTVALGSAGIWEWDGSTWTQRCPAAACPAAAPSAFDVTRGVVVSLVAGETWTWDGATWVHAASAGPQSGRLAYDSARQRTVLFGAGSNVAETWEWDGATWTQACATAPCASTVPAGRVAFVMAYDAQRARTVVQGGISVSSGQNLADQWEWDGMQWIQLADASFGGRNYHAMSYDIGRGRLVVFGGDVPIGAGTIVTAEVWERIGSSWTKRTAGTPPPRRNAALAYDSVRGRVVLAGGTGLGVFNDVWEWDGSRWLLGASGGGPFVPTQAMAYDRARGVVVAVAEATWLWNGTKWAVASNVTPRGSFGEAYDALAYDSARGRVVHFAHDTIEWDGTSWTVVTTTGPPARTQHALAFDAARGKTVVFGGVDTSSTVLGDLWEWDGVAWTQRCTDATCQAAMPAARSGHAMAYDAARQRVVVFGGVSVGTAAVSGETWEWDGTGFTRLLPDGPGRALHAMTFDAARGRVVMFGGSPLNGDTWEYHLRGGACSGGFQCDTGFCADQVCCESFRCDACQACDTGGAPGVCTTLTNTHDQDSCSGTLSCGPTGNCGVADGVTCALGNDCASTFCVDGVCCGSACNGACEVCTFVPGTCTPAPRGASGSPLCAPFVCDGSGGACPSSCLDDRACAADAYCAIDHTCTPRKLRGQACNPMTDCTLPGCRECASGQCADGYCCDFSCEGACDRCDATPGVCQVTAQGAPASAGCGAYACTGTSVTCPMGCVSDTDCQAPARCLGGQCKGSRPIGNGCQSDAQCSSGHCADGVCCDSACAGACDRCDLDPGTCVIAPKGTASLDCLPYLCDGISTACPTQCASSQACFDGASCVEGSCASQGANGQGCILDGNCVSRHCSDDVCCATACVGACQRCDSPAALGLCQPTPGISCGEGACSGACGPEGSCTGPAAGTACDTCTVCDGHGACAMLPASGDDAACAPVICSLLSTECRRYEDVVAARCATPHLCASASASTCPRYVDVEDGASCAEGVCLGGMCVAAPLSGAGGCDLGARAPARDQFLALWLVVLLVIVRRSSRRGRAVPPDPRTAGSRCPWAPPTASPRWPRRRW